MSDMVFTATGLAFLFRPLRYVFSNKLAIDFLFGGEVQSMHMTRFALEKFVSRYEQSIKTLNRAIIVSITFVPFALIPLGDTVTIPIVDLDVSQQNWLRLCPAISYGLQFFTLVALCWFLLLRRGLDVLGEKVGKSDDFGEIANIVLAGVVGSLWMIFSIRRHLPSKLHLIWFLPLTLLLVFVLFSPAVLCGYFVKDLFVAGDFAPATIYSFMLPPSVALAVALLSISVISGMREVLP